MYSQLIVIVASGLFALGGIWVLISGFDDDDNDGDGMTFPEFQSLGTQSWKQSIFKGLLAETLSHKVKAKIKVTMADVKLNPDSDDLGTKFKIIGISVTLGLNVIVFIWYFFFSGLN